MYVRFITGNLAADPEVQQAGRVSITKFTVLENTAEYRGDQGTDVGGSTVASSTPPTSAPTTSVSRSGAARHITVLWSRSACVAGDGGSFPSEGQS